MSRKMPSAMFGIMAAALLGMGPSMSRASTGLDQYSEAIDDQKKRCSMPTGYPVDAGSGRRRRKKNTPSKRQRSLALKA